MLPREIINLSPSTFGEIEEEAPSLPRPTLNVTWSRIDQLESDESSNYFDMPEELCAQDRNAFAEMSRIYPGFVARFSTHYMALGCKIVKLLVELEGSDLLPACNVLESKYISQDGDELVLVAHPDMHALLARIMPIVLPAIAHTKMVEIVRFLEEKNA